LAKTILDAGKMGSGRFLTGRASNRNIDSYEDIWALDFPAFPLEDGTLKLEICDENSKINLNAFANEVTEQTRYYYMAQTFFINMGLPVDFAHIIHDWIDIDDSRLPYGAESGDYYMTLTPPYRAKNSALDSMDELFMLKGITPEIFYGLGRGNFGKEENLVTHNKGDLSIDIERLTEMLSGDNSDMDEKRRDIKIGKEKTRALEEYFRVYGDNKDFLHDYNKININTASYRVISALTENMTDDKVTEIIRRRLIKPFSTVNEIKDIIQNDSEFEILRKYITVRSFIFRIKATAYVNSTGIKIIVYYNRDNKKLLYWCEE
jgi:type II secretory pathway component PulK